MRLKTLFIAAVLAAGLLLSPVAGAESMRMGTSVQFGNDVLVPAGIVRNGDVVAIFGDVTVDGEVRGNAVAVGGSAVINGTVSGDVVAVGGGIEMGENGRVQGDVTSVGAGIVGNNYNISGEVTEVGIPALRGMVFRPHWRWGAFRFSFGNPFWHLFLMAGLFSVALIVMSLFPRQTDVVADTLEKNLPRSILIGFAAGLAVMPVTFVLLISIVGIMAIPVLWLAILLAKILGYTGMVLLVGRKVLGMAQTSRNAVTTLAVGVAIIGLLGYVPVINVLLSLFAGMATIGATLDTKFGTNRPWFPPRHNGGNPV